MREELEIFENRSDDWLAKQRKYEEKISVWDFDEAKKIKEEHARKHQLYNQRMQIQQRQVDDDDDDDNKEIEKLITKQVVNRKKTKQILPFIIIGIYLFIFMIIMFI